MVTMIIVSRENPDGSKNDNDRAKESEQRVSDLDTAVFALCHVHEHEKLQRRLNEGETENDPKFSRWTQFSIHRNP